MGQYNRIADIILKRDMLLERFRIVDSELEHSKGIRRMLVDNYSVFNVIQDEKGFALFSLINKSIIKRDYYVSKYNRNI